MLPLIPIIVGVSLTIAANEAYQIHKLRKNYGVSSEDEFKKKYKISLGAYKRMVEVKKMFDKDKAKPKFKINLSKPSFSKKG